MSTVIPKSRDLGGFSVRRILPALQCRSVGPFVFFDEMGPLVFKTGRELEVRPHPHIGLATLTWLFEGGLMHRDSLGSAQVIHPGAVNLMTAGRGIVHSERASQAGTVPGMRAHGVQFWLGLPRADEDCAPRFEHHPAESIPSFRTAGGVSGRVVIGHHQGLRSPAAFPDALCLDLMLDPGARLELPPDPAYPERAVYLLREQVLKVAGPGAPLLLEAVVDPAHDAGTRVLVIGGAPLDGPRYLDWNFVASTKERLAEAKAEWAEGPGGPGSRFPQVPGETEFIPYPP